jgi:hemerythrin-like metal-binding protein
MSGDGDECLIRWQPEFRLGVPAVDYEHESLIRLINELYRQVRSSPDREAVSAFLGDIYAEISAHFALEEKMMLEAGYDGYAEHKADHERLLDELAGIIDACDRGAPVGDAEFGEVLTRWFVDHFRTEDARLHHRLG